MHTQKKLFGKIKINVIPAPAENSAKPNTRFMRSPPWLRPQKNQAPVYYIVCRRLVFILFLYVIYFTLPGDSDGSFLYNSCQCEQSDYVRNDHQRVEAVGHIPDSRNLHQRTDDNERAY